MMVFANILGSMANEMLPQGMIMVFLMLIILVGILINIRNAVKKFREESIALGNVHFNPDQNNEKKKIHDQQIELKESLINNMKNSNVSANLDINHPKDQELERLKYYESRNYHPVKTPLFIGTILLTIIYFLFKGSKSLPSVIGLQKCHWAQKWILIITVIGVIIIQFLSVRLVLLEQNLKIKHGLQLPHEVLLTPKIIALLIAFATVVGLLANLLGLGGGFVIFPMFVSIGVSPLVASATTIFMILLSKIVAAILALFSPFLKGDYTVMMVVSVGLSVLLFSFLADFIIKK